MRLFFTDECLVHGSEPTRRYGLSLYGGLILDEWSFKYLSNFLYSIKEKYVLPQNLELKWGFKKVWENMQKVNYLAPEIKRKKDNPSLYNSLKSDYDKLKEEILDEVSKSKATIVIAIRPNSLLRATRKQEVVYSIEAISRKFNKILKKNNDLGIILADELQKKFSKENTDYEYILNICYDILKENEKYSLVSIVPTVDSQVSPIHQINDIVLGAIQYYILEFVRYLNDYSRDISKADKILNKLKSNFHTHIHNSKTYVINSGILLYPPRNSRDTTFEAGIFLNKLEEQLKKSFDIK